MSLVRIPAAVALAVAGGLFAGAAHAGGVRWSVNINVPGPVYAEPVYAAPPVYHAPAPVYHAPPPVYYTPPPVYYQPRPVVVYRPPVVVYHRGPPAIRGGSWERHRPDRGWRDRPGRWERDRGHFGGR